MFPSKSAPACKSVGEWLSLVEHLVRDQGVGGSNPLSPTNLSLTSSIAYPAFVIFVLGLFFGTFGAIETEVAFAASVLETKITDEELSRESCIFLQRCDRIVFH